MEVEKCLGAVQYTTIKQPYQIHSFSTSQKTTNYKHCDAKPGNEETNRICNRHGGKAMMPGQ